MVKRYKNLLRGAGVLAVCASLAKVIGMLYRIPLTNILGTDGIGLYQMVFPLYTVLLTISSGGLPVAIAKSVAGASEAEGKQILKCSLIALIIAGTIAAAVIFVFSDFLAKLQGNSDASLAYKGIAPALIFVAVISCFRGYFQGKQNMLPTAISQLNEQLVKLFLGVFFAKMLMPYGASYGVLGSVLGVSLSELFALIVLVFTYFTGGGARNPHAALLGKWVRPKAILKNIYRVAIPVTLGSLVLPLTGVVDSMLVINILTRVGARVGEATSLYGLVTGPVNSLINMPTVITLAISGALLPKISQLFASRKPLIGTVNKSIKISVLFGALFALGLFIFSTLGMKVLYSGGLTDSEIKLGAQLIRLGALSVFYVSILQVATAVLQGTNHARLPALNLMYGAIVKLVLTLVLLPLIGVAGAVAATTACYALTCLLDCLAMRKYVKM